MHLRTLQSHRIHAYTTPGASSRRPCPLHRIIKNHIHHPSSSSRTLFPFYAFTRNFQSTSFAYSIHIIHSQQLTRSSHSSTSFAHVAWHHVFYDPLTTTKTLFHLVRELKTEIFRCHDYFRSYSSVHVHELNSCVSKTVLFLSVRYHRGHFLPPSQHPASIRSVSVLQLMHFTISGSTISKCEMYRLSISYICYLRSTTSLLVLFSLPPSLLFGGPPLLARHVAPSTPFLIHDPPIQLRPRILVAFLPRPSTFFYA